MNARLERIERANKACLRLERDNKARLERIERDIKETKSSTYRKAEPFLLLLFGFVLSGFVGNLLAKEWQSREIDRSLAREAQEDLAIAGGDRQYRAFRFFEGAKDGVEMEVMTERWHKYEESVDFWNAQLQLTYARMEQLFGKNLQSRFYREEGTAGRTSLTELTIELDRHLRSVKKLISSNEPGEDALETSIFAAETAYKRAAGLLAEILTKMNDQILSGEVGSDAPRPTGEQSEKPTDQVCKSGPEDCGSLLRDRGSALGSAC